MADPKQPQGERLAIRALDRRIATLEHQIELKRAEIAQITALRTRVIVKQEVETA